MRRLTALLLAFATLAADPAGAAVFEFNWTGDPLEDAAIVASDDPTLRAAGTIEIDAAAGTGFTADDIVAVDILLSGDTLGSVRITDWISGAGTISADGSSAAFALNEVPAGGAFPQYFGCRFFDLESGEACVSNLNLELMNALAIRNPDTLELLHVQYASAEAAAGSLQMTAVVPLPASLLLLGTAFAGLALVGRTGRLPAG